MPFPTRYSSYGSRGSLRKAKNVSKKGHLFQTEYLNNTHFRYL